MLTSQIPRDYIESVIVDIFNVENPTFTIHRKKTETVEIVINLENMGDISLSQLEVLEERLSASSCVITHGCEKVEDYCECSGHNDGECHCYLQTRFQLRILF